MNELKGLTNLQLLDLGDSKVTDAGLKDLQELKNLHMLDLDGTQITTQG